MSSFEEFKKKLTGLWGGVPEKKIVWIGWALLGGSLLLTIFLPSTPAFLGIVFLTLITGIILIVLLARLQKIDSETKLERNELKSILLNLADPLFVYSKDFKIIFFNPAAERLFSLDREALVGRVMSPQDVHDQKYHLLTQVLFTSLAPVMVARSEAGAYPQITDLSWEDPFLHLRSSTMPLKDDNGEVVAFMKIIRDRTREVSLLKAKNEFVTVASHQLRTPVTNIKWSLELLAGETNLSQTAKETIQSAQAGTAYLLAVVEDLLRTSKIEEGRFGYEMKSFSMIEFIDRILALVLPQAEQAGIKVYFERPTGETPPIYGDEQKLTMVFENLLDNAIRYNVKSGEVVVSLEVLKDTPFLKVQIRDTGIGIPKEDLDKLFVKFFRASNVMKLQTNGTGLGLYIVKNIIQAHGGELTVTSEVGRGTTFIFTLATDRSVVPSREVPLEY